MSKSRTNNPPLATPPPPASAATDLADLGTARHRWFNPVTLSKLVIGLFFFAYIGIRILNLDLTGDEFAARLSYTDLLTLKNIEEQLQPLIYFFATLSMDIFSLDTATEIRIPCFFIFLLYLFAVAKTTRRLRPVWLEIAAFAAFLCNPFMLDFFSIERGYCLAVVFVLLSAIYLVEWIEAPPDTRKLKGYAALWWAGFALLSNLSCLHFYLAACAVLVLKSANWKLLAAGWRSISTWWQFIRQLFLDNLYVLANALMLLIFWAPRVVLQIQTNQLYSGGTTGFIYDTIGTLVKCTFYDVQVPQSVWLSIAIALAVASVSITIHAATQRRNPAFMPVLVFSSLLMLFTFSVEAQFYLADVRFVWQRMALQILPLFVGQVCFYIAAVRAPWLRIIGAAFLLVWLGTFPASANLTHTQAFRMNSRTRQLLRDMTAVHDQLGRNIVIGISDNIKPKFQYYIDDMGIKWLDWYPVDMYTRFNGQYQIHPQSDFFYIEHRNGKFPEGMKNLPIEPVPGSDYSAAQCGLYRVKEGANLGLLLQPAPAP